MPYLLRKIKNKSNWFRKPALPKEVTLGEISADVLGDLITTNNALSVWAIEDDRSNLPRVLAAIAATRDNLQKCDYLLFDRSAAEARGLKLRQTPATSPDSEAAGTWHFELVDLTVGSLADLAKEMFCNGEAARVFERELLDDLRQSIQSGFFATTSLRPNVVASLSEKPADERSGA